MSELGSSSDMPFEIRAVHDVGYPGGDNENAPFGRLPGANCAQSSGVTQVIFLPIFPPSVRKKKSSRLVLRRPVELEAALEV